MELHKKSELYGRGWLAGVLLQSRDMHVMLLVTLNLLYV